MATPRIRRSEATLFDTVIANLLASPAISLPAKAAAGVTFQRVFAAGPTGRESHVAPLLRLERALACWWAAGCVQVVIDAGEQAQQGARGARTAEPGKQRRQRGAGHIGDLRLPISHPVVGAGHHMSVRSMAYAVCTVSPCHSVTAVMSTRADSQDDADAAVCRSTGNPGCLTARDSMGEAVLISTATCRRPLILWKCGKYCGNP